MPKHTKESIRSYLKDAPIPALSKGVLSLYALQTQDEQDSKTVNRRNDMGFSGKTVSMGTKIASYLLKGNKMKNSFYISKAREICIEHAKQLANIANDGDLKKIRDRQFKEWGLL